MRSAFAIVAFAILFFIYNDFLFNTLLFGPRNSNFITYKVLCKISHVLNLGQSLCLEVSKFKVINTDLSGQFTMHIWSALVAGLVCAFPYVVWELWQFTKPALKLNELKKSRGIIWAVSFLFLLGVAFGYFIIVPLSINFLASYQLSPDIENYISMDSYISNVTTVTLMTGIVFELPVVIYFLSVLGIVTPTFLRTYRKHAVIIILLIAAIITPSPDVSSQLLVAFPLYLLFEISIFVSAMVVKQKLKTEKEF